MIKFKTTEYYENLSDEEWRDLSYHEQIRYPYTKQLESSSDFRKYKDRSGIYSISIASTNQIIYIGQAKNIATRIIDHLVSTFEPSNKEYSTFKYSKLREFIADGQILNFSILTYCREQELNSEETKYIQQYNPILNTIKTKTKGAKMSCQHQ